jgi:uncharacterized protein YerC
MSGTIDFAHAAQRLRRSVGKSSFSTASIERVERVLDHATELQKEAKANIKDVILVLEESATRMRRIGSLFSQATVETNTFRNQLAEIEQLIKILRGKTARL